MVNREWGRHHILCQVDVKDRGNGVLDLLFLAVEPGQQALEIPLRGPQLFTSAREFKRIGRCPHALVCFVLSCDCSSDLSLLPLIAGVEDQEMAEGLDCAAVGFGDVLGCLIAEVSGEDVEGINAGELVGDVSAFVKRL